MQLDDFLQDLHFHIDKVRPPDLVVNWEDAPLPFKLYDDLPVTVFPSDVSLTLEANEEKSRDRATLRDIGDLFCHSYGITQLSHLAIAGEGATNASFMQTLRRFVPSGGALYPSEMYAYLKIDDLSPGIYHYDVAHHQLVCLRKGNFDEYLERSLGQPSILSFSFGCVFVSTMFWKNYFKYHDFSYRLQGLDAGVVVGQVLEVAKQIGFDVQVHFQFLDRAVNHLLGLNEQEESVYAVLPLRLHACATIANGPFEQRNEERDEVLCGEVCELSHRHLLSVGEASRYPTITKANEAAMLHSTHSFRRISGVSQRGANKDELPIDEIVMRLPPPAPVEYRFTDACRSRYSPGLDFVSRPMSMTQLSTLLFTTLSGFSYTNDMDETFQSRVELAVCAYGVDGLVDGAYVYDKDMHALKLRRKGDHRPVLQQGLSMPNVNLFQVPLCLHLVGSRDFYQSEFGFRGYRMQQMQTGILLQRLLLTVSAMGFGGHPLLGYDESVCDDIYGFDPEEKTCLIQVPIGSYRSTSRFEVGVYG